MRLTELEEMMNEEPSDAEAAIAGLVSSSNVAELTHIARAGRVQALRLRAIEGLEEVGGPAATAALVEILEAVSTPFMIGGTEQKLEHQGMQGRLVQSVARARGVPAPTIGTEREMAEFIKSVRRR